ncbi:Hsp20/alpha crystallin family protein [Lactobacillus sp. PSON]|uniref:Hsp20/alpha crystallin family protein n=1 Tax=Lactobacillus sp. PSON TaxID=3455454 RepID=UPI004041D6BE
MANEMMNRHDDVFDAMNDWFGFPRNFFDDKVANIMQADLSETDKDYIVTIDMPGFDKDKIHINYHDGILNVSGIRKSEKNETAKNGDVIHKERSQGHVSRSFRLSNVVANQIHAKYDDGVLTITLPKQSADANNSSIQID